MRVHEQLIRSKFKVNFAKILVFLTKIKQKLIGNNKKQSGKIALTGFLSPHLESHGFLFKILIQMRFLSTDKAI